MKIKLSWFISFLVFLPSALPVRAFAQEDTDKRTFEQLDRFWTQMVDGGSSDLSAVYPTLFSDTPQSSSPTTLSRLEGVWEGNGVTQDIQFPVRSIPSRYDGQLSRREMGLSMYLARESGYQPPVGTTTVETMKLRPRIALEQKTLTTRRTVALTELFNIKLLRYQAARTFEAKCASITEADRLLTLANAQTVSVSDTLLSSLTSVAKTQAQRFSKDLKSKFPCTARPKATRASLQREIEAGVNDLALGDLNKVNSVTIAAIQSRLALYDQALGEIRKIDPKTEELLAAERDLKAAGSNIKLIASDLFEIKTLFPQLEAIDFSRITNVGDPHFVPDQIKAVDAASQQLVDNSKFFLKKLGDVPSAIKAEERPKFATCLGLDKDFEAALPKPGTTVTTMPAFLQKYESCLSKLTAYLTDLQKKDPEQAMVDQFATYLQSLSNEIIAN